MEYSYRSLLHCGVLRNRAGNYSRLLSGSRKGSIRTTGPGGFRKSCLEGDTTPLFQEVSYYYYYYYYYYYVA